jgi:predicted phage terminase large subunit-like protein
MNEELYGRVLRTDLGTFIERVFVHLFPNTPFLPNWHIELIACKLEAVLEGKIKRLIINVPPRSLKSVIASVAFVAWALGRNPSMQFICASYGQDLADKLALDCRTVMQSDWYKRLFGVRLTSGRPAVADFSITAGGGRFATSVGGVLTGRGGNIIVIDDPLKPSEAMSDAERKSANDWFDHTVTTRLNDKKTGAIVIIMQRLHEDDLVGHVLEQEDWEVLSLPAIAEVEQRFVIKNIFGEREVIRAVDDVLHPAREPLDVLKSLRATLREYHFSGQYQQAPAPLDGGIFQVKWMHYYEPHERPEKFDHIVQSWDTASKETELSDYSVCTTWGLKGPYHYLLHVLRARMDYPTLKRSVVEQIQRFHPQVVLIEDKASGIQLIQELRAMGHSIIKEYKPVGDKVMRARAQTSAFEGGFVHLPRQAAWLDAYVLELTTFNRGKFDDQVDSTSQALAWIAINGVEPGIITYYRMLAQQQNPGLR